MQKMATAAISNILQHNSLPTSGAGIGGHVTEGNYHGLCRTTWLLWKESISASDFHHRLRVVRGKAAPGRSTFLPMAVTLTPESGVWKKESHQADIPAMVQHASEKVTEDSRVT
jgi:hypothetical protein